MVKEKKIKIGFNREFECEYGVMVQVSPMVRRIVANNPGPYTFKGTGTYIIGSEKVAVIDPGPNDKNHVDAKKGVLGNRKVASLYDLITAQNLQESRAKRDVKPYTWHRARIIVNGSHVEHWLDNIKMLEFNRHSQTFNSLVNYSKYQKWPGFGQADSGHILLQEHGDEVHFKNIKIREF